QDEGEWTLELGEQKRKRIRSLLGLQKVWTVLLESSSGFIVRQALRRRLKPLKKFRSRDAPVGFLVLAVLAAQGNLPGLGRLQAGTVLRRERSGRVMMHPGWRCPREVP